MKKPKTTEISIANVFVFKYDKHHNLYNYVEYDRKNNNLINYYNFNYKNNSVIKYDTKNKIKIFNQFEVPTKLVHRFEAGESWIRPATMDSDPFNVTFPKVKKQFAVNFDNQIVGFSVNEQIISQWR